MVPDPQAQLTEGLDADVRPHSVSAPESAWPDAKDVESGAADDGSAETDVPCLVASGERRRPQVGRVSVWRSLLLSLALHGSALIVALYALGGPLVRPPVARLERGNGGGDGLPPGGAAGPLMVAAPGSELPRVTLEEVGVVVGAAFEPAQGPAARAELIAGAARDAAHTADFEPNPWSAPSPQAGWPAPLGLGVPDLSVLPKPKVRRSPPMVPMVSSADAAVAAPGSVAAPAGDAVPAGAAGGNAGRADAPGGNDPGGSEIAAAVAPDAAGVGAVSPVSGGPFVPAQPAGVRGAGGGGNRGARGGVDGRGLPIPAYPDVSRRNGEEGVVVLEVEVLPDGAVGSVRVVSSPGFDRLTRAAVNAVRRARFTPATRGRRPVASIVKVPFRFVLGVVR